MKNLDKHIVSSDPGVTRTAATQDDSLPEELTNVARAASIIAIGTIISRVLGLVRDIAKSYYFGATGLVSAFNIASKIPMWFYDLLAGGMINAALIPVFSSYSRAENRQELWLITSFLLTLCVALLTPLVILGEIFAEEIAWVVSGGMTIETLETTAKLLRITLPAILFLNFAGILAGLLYSLKRFVLPAFNAAMFNLGIVLSTILFARSLGVYALAVGLLAGSALQVVLQLPGIRDTQLSPVINWRHPAIRRIARLYLPIALGLIVDMISRGISYRLASTTGDQSIAWMDYATTIMQFPLGLTSTAISIAILPTLARQATWSNVSGNKDFLATLSHALRLVTVLIVPAAIGLLILARPVVELILEHGDFMPKDTEMTTFVLRLYLAGIIAAALDLPLINAFYARQEAWTPALVGVGGVIVYLVAALTPSMFRPMQLGDLIIANSIQLCFHSVLMYILLHRRVGSMRGHRLVFTATRSILAACVMGLVTAGMLWGIALISWPNQLLKELASVFIPGIIGTICYINLINFMKVPEIAQIFRLMKSAKIFTVVNDEH